jgi:hypothetical protein
MPRWYPTASIPASRGGGMLPVASALRENSSQAAPWTLKVHQLT